MRVLYITSEVFPFAKTGGLADVSASLPGALKELGIDLRLLVPGYRQALERAPNLKQIYRGQDPLGTGEFRVLESHLPRTDVPVWFIDAPQLYDRSGGYIRTNPARTGRIMHCALLS